MNELPRALVVEDDLAWQQILVELLADAGFQVDVAADAGTALARLRAVPHRLAVVDLSLAAVDHRNRQGLDVLTAVQTHDPGCTTILLTGFATVELAVSALNDYGAFTCLRKESFRRREFRQLLRQILAQPPVAASTAPSPSPRPATPPTVSEHSAHILVLDDDAGWRSVLSELLADAGHRVIVCGAYGEALAAIQRQNIDLAIVDLALRPSAGIDPSSGGYRLLRHLQHRNIPTLVLSGMASPHEIEQVYATYAIHSFLEKQSFNRQTFWQAVDAALATAAPSLLTTLTGREQEVLALMAQGLSNKEIARELVISPNTVKRHTLAVFSKLGVNSRAAAVAVYLHASPQTSRGGD